MKKSPFLIFVFGLFIFVLAVMITRGLLQFVKSDFIWLEQVLLKTVLIVLSLLGIKFILKAPLTDVGFRKEIAPVPWGKVVLSGMAVGALTSLLFFFSPTEGNTLVRQLNLLEFILVIVIWSSVAEEIFIRGLIQPFMRSFVGKKVRLLRLRISVSVLVSAAVFASIHLSLLFAGMDYYTVVFTVIATFILGLLAGIFRENYGSIFPSIVTHMSFNFGGIIMGIVIAVIYRKVTGEFPPH